LWQEIGLVTLPHNQKLSALNMNQSLQVGFETVELSSNAWWLHQIREMQNWSPGGVFALFLGPVSCVAPAAAWFTTATGLMQLDGRPLFVKTLVVTPPGFKNSDYNGRFRGSIESTYTNNKKDIPTDLRQALENPGCVLEESECERVLARLEELPEGSAVGICAAQRLRFRDFAPAHEPGIKTHTGFTVRHVTGEQLTFPHLFELLRRLLTLATTRKLSVVLFVEQFAMEIENLPDDCRNHPQLAMCSTKDNPDAVARFLAKLKAEEIRREKGVDAALQHIQEKLREPEHQAHATAMILGAEGRWFEAWSAIKPNLEKLRAIEDPNVLLNLALTATACGEADEAATSLTKALQVGFDTVEEFNSAALVAREIEAWKTLDEVLAGMIRGFPNHPMTIARSYGRLMSTNRYAEAAEMARKAGHGFEEAWAILNDQNQPDWDAFFTVATATQREVEAFAKAARYCSDRGDLGKAKEFLAQIPCNETNAPTRAAVLLEGVAKQIQFAKKDADFEEIKHDLAEVLRYVALNPTATDLRMRLTHIFEVTLDDASRHLVLILCCLDVFHRAEPLFDLKNATAEESPFNFENPNDSCDATADFMRAVVEANQGRPLGRGVLPRNYQKGVSNEVMSGLGILVHAYTKEPDLKGIGAALQCLSIACRARKEATWDLQCAVQLLSTLAAHGRVSDALNLAETILFFWPESLPEFHSARLAHAWGCLADIYHRSRNLLTALLHLTICLEAMVAKPAPQHVSMLKQKLRLGTRIFRDLRFNEFARMFIAREHALVEALPERERELKEIVTSEAFCRLQEIHKDTPIEELSEIFKMTRELLDDPNETEWGVPVSVGVSLLSICRGYGIKLPNGFSDLVGCRIPKCPPPFQRLFRRFLLEHPMLADIEGLMRDLVEGNVNDDQGYRFAMVDGLLRRAVTTSCQRNDPELFLLAATWLSQPALAASRATWQVSSDRPEAKLANITELFPAGSEPATARARDYALAMQRQIERTESNFKRFVPLPLSAVCYVATVNEALCFLAHDSEERLCRLVVRRDGIEGPTQLEKAEWDRSRFIQWQKTYPEGYSWDRNYGTFGDYDTPDLSEIRSSLNQLQAAIPTDAQTVTVLPEADLFGFPYFLNEQRDRWVGELTQCVTAPSLTWLATVRQLPQPKSISVKAWLGHPTLADNAVMRPRNELTPILGKHGGQIIKAETPQPLWQSDIAVVLSHGSRGLFRGFVGFDDVGQFTIEELAGWLGECKCVILFVCNAGRSDVRLFNNETFGLVGRLLKRDVRAVIAPPAPLRNNLPAIWFAPFLECVRKGQPIGAAHANACAVLRAQFPHPCAWGALQLFGDPNLSFPLQPGF
jgi:tetratricopeptide (TPR) repeat protein